MLSYSCFCFCSMIGFVEMVTALLWTLEFCPNSRAPSFQLLTDNWSPVLVGCTSGLPNVSWELPRVECQNLIINNYTCCILRFYTEIEENWYILKNLCMIFAHIPPPSEGSVGACEGCRTGSSNACCRNGSSSRNHISFFGTKIHLSLAYMPSVLVNLWRRDRYTALDLRPSIRYL